MKAWHFLPEDRRLRWGSKEVVEAGRTYRAEGRLALCENGMHASVRAIDALGYAPGPIVCRVELLGEIIKDTDKAVARERHVLWMGDATLLLHEFALVCAEEALDATEARGLVVDPRSRTALAVKRRWLVGEVTDAELTAAQAAAWAAEAATRDAAWAAAASARDAARAAADATRDAAWAAAWAAARAAEDAAWAAARAAAQAAARDAAWAAQNVVLETMLESLAPSR